MELGVGGTTDLLVPGTGLYIGGGGGCDISCTGATPAAALMAAMKLGGCGVG